VEVFAGARGGESKKFWTEQGGEVGPILQATLPLRGD
jgi:hypothetical protein